ncbi:MAG TPA: HAD-IA family hydrolase [Woeseiaceae bacterium]|nr:HAD-IA family hydrolase [Woeseiaceae bacterium]
MSACNSLPARARGVLFDLDGTLVDTAPDMVTVLADLQEAHGLEPLAYEVARAHVSNGAIGLLRLAFPDVPADALGPLHSEYLERYAQALCVRSALFPGLGQLLDDLDRANCPWGVVTNKPGRLTVPLMGALQLADRAGCVVSGDTLPQRKPHPAPLLLAARTLGVAPQASVYIGDAARDIEAGRAAGMATVAAAYGYIVPGDEPSGWGANSVVSDTDELAHVLLKAVNLRQ